jgi:hypothetical protein
MTAPQKIHCDWNNGMPNITCKSFTDYLSRKSEHLDEEIIKDITPLAGWIGHVSTGKFAAEDGVSHTYDRFTRVMPDLTHAWTDVTNQSCVGTPCDPDETCIGFGYVRDSYKVQQASFDTDLFCFDQIMSADRAKEQFAHIINDVLRPATSIIMSDRLKTEAFRIAGDYWIAGGVGLPPGLNAFTWTETGNLTNLIPSVLPTSKLSNRMLQRRVEPQLLRGALGANPFNSPPKLEFVTGLTDLDELMHDGNITDSWRYQSLGVGGEFYKYGWLATVGNYGIRVDPHPPRFQLSNDGVTLNRVYPYVNIAATQGIRGIDNPQYSEAPYQISYVWHREAMKYLVQDTTDINALMPFAKRDFGGKWQFVMDGLVCKQVDGTLTPVDNRRRNKGQFIADFRGATKKVHNEWCEVILHMREAACVYNIPPCDDSQDYVEQDYNSCNEPCDEEEEEVQ